MIEIDWWRLTDSDMQYSSTVAFFLRLNVELPSSSRYASLIHDNFEPDRTSTFFRKHFFN